MMRYGVNKFRIDAGHVGELRTCGARRRLIYWRYQILSFGGHDCASLQRMLSEFHSRDNSRVGWSWKVRKWKVQASRVCSTTRTERVGQPVHPPHVIGACCVLKECSCYTN